MKTLPHYARFECPAGEATFSVHQVEYLPSGEGTWVYFETDQPDELVQALQVKGLDFEQLPQDQPWLWQEVRLRDPDHNLVILYFAGTNRKSPPWLVVSAT